MNILFVRGAFLNPYEFQNYSPLSKRHHITIASSKLPIASVSNQNIRTFFSPYDLVSLASKIHPLMGRVAIAIENRTIGDGHSLIGLDHFVRSGLKIDIAIGAETYYGYDLQLARLKKEGSIKKLVSVCWEVIPHNNESLQSKLIIKKEVMPYVDMYICPTHKAKLALITEGVDEDTIKVINIGVDQSRFQKRLVNRSNVTILFVGRLVSEKGIYDLPAMFDAIYTTYTGDKTLLFKVIGNGPLKHWLRDNTKHLPVEIESVEYGMMPTVYKNATILVVPSKTTNTWSEQYGMVIVEALSSGVPVVAYDSGAIREVVGPGGILVKEGDSSAMSLEVNKLLQNKLKYNKIAKKASDYAKENYSSIKQSHIIENLLSGLLSPI